MPLIVLYESVLVTGVGASASDRRKHRRSRWKNPRLVDQRYRLSRKSVVLVPLFVVCDTD